MGRVGLAPRSAYYLISKKTKKCMYVLKKYTLVHKKDISEFNNEINMSKLITTGKCRFPAKYVNNWRSQDIGYIQFKCLHNSIGWEKLSNDKLPKALKMVVQQLKYIHKLGFIHGDLAPKNIVVNKYGTASIIDFEDVRKLTKKREKSDWAYLQSGFAPYSQNEILEIKNSNLSNKQKMVYLKIGKRNKTISDILKKYVPEKYRI